jgi:hypothetical protein
MDSTIEPEFIVFFVFCGVLDHFSMFFPLNLIYNVLLLVKRIEENFYTVQSQSGNGEYAVTKVGHEWVSEILWSEKMKICFLAPELYPIWGGGGTYAIGLLKYLPKDVEVHVLALRRKVPEDKNASKESAMSFLGDNIHVYNLADEKDTFFSHANFQRLCYKWISKLDKELHFDIVHSQHQPMSDILLKLMSKNFRYITTVHETFSRRNEAIKQSKVGFEGFESSEKWMVSLSPFLKTIEKLYMRKSHAFISPSKWMQNMLH